MISEIDSICPQSIPWVTSDANQNFSVPWQPDDRTDHILQLIFLDQTTSKPKNFRHWLTYYNLRILESRNEKIKTESIIFAANYLISTYHNLNVDKEFIEKIHFDETPTQYKGITFDSIFGKYEQKRALMIEHFSITRCKNTANEERDRVISWKGDTYSTNYFTATLNASFVNLKTVG